MLKTKKTIFYLLPFLMSTMLAAVFVFSGILGNLPVVGEKFGAAEAYADDYTECRLWVAGTQVTSENCNNILNAIDPETKKPTASYDPATEVLELHNPVNSDNNSRKAFIESEIPLNIKGTLDLNVKKEVGAFYGINSNKDIRIFEDEETSTNIKIKVSGEFNCAITGICVSGANLVMDGGRLSVKGQSNGIVTISGEQHYNSGYVEAENTAGNPIYASRDKGQLFISDDLEITEPVGGINDGKSILDKEGNEIRRAVIEEKKYPLWLGDTQVSYKNKDNILNKTNDGEPTASYDPASKTLTLRNPNIIGAHNDYKIWTTDSLTIQGRANIVAEDEAGREYKGVCVNYEPTSTVTAQSDLKTLTIKEDPDGGTDIGIYANFESIKAINTNVIMDGGSVFASSNIWRSVNIQYHGSFIMNDGYMDIVTGSTDNLEGLRTWNPSPANKFGTPLADGNKVTINGGRLEVFSASGEPIKSGRGIKIPGNYCAYDEAGNVLELHTDGDCFADPNNKEAKLKKAKVIIEPKKYTITTTAVVNGKVEADKEKAAAGEMVNVTVDADAEYRVKKVSVMSSQGPVETTVEGEKYTFIMPASDVTVSATTEPEKDETQSGTCGKNGDNLTWEYNVRTKTLTISGTGAMEDYEYTAHAPWKKYYDEITTVIVEDGVTTIGREAFSRLVVLENVTLPDSVTEIKFHAFQGAELLESIDLPSNLTTLGNAAFYGCYKLDNVTIPDGVETIPDSAFASCNALTNVVLGKNTKIIDYQAFYSTNIQSIDIPKSVKAIYNGAFAYTKIKEITIPKSVTELGGGVFSDCDDLTTIFYEGTEAQWNALTDGVNLGINPSSVTIKTLKETNVVIDEEVTTYLQSTKEPIMMHWNVYDGNNEAITNKLTEDHCIFTLNGTSYNCSKEKYYYLDDNDALISEPGEYSYTITFRGDKTLGYQSSEYHGKLKVVKKKDFAVSFSLPDTVPVGEPLPMSGTLTDEDGNPIAGVTMGFWVTGHGFNFNKVDESSTVTDENGVWTYSGTELTPNMSGKYNLSNMWVTNYNPNKYNRLRFPDTISFRAAEGTAFESFDRLEINADEVKKTYKCCEAFDTTGLKVRGFFTDESGQTYDRDLSDEDYKVIPGKLTGGCKLVAITYSEYGRTRTATIPITLNHEWDGGKVTKKATTKVTGVKTYTCNACKHTRTEVIPKLPDPATQVGVGGSPIATGASAEAANKAITTSKSEEGPKGSKFAPLMLKSSSQGKTNIKLSWKKPKGAKKFVIYGSACGTKNRMKKIATVTGTSYNVKKLEKGNYYKYMVVSLNAQNKVVSTSKVAHVATKGGKIANYKSVSVSKKVIKNAKKLKRGKTLKLGAKAKGAKVKKHRGIAYESSNPKIATVNGKGVVKGIKKGTCTIYAYAQNGVVKAVKVTVK